MDYSVWGTRELIEELERRDSQERAHIKVCSVFDCQNMRVIDGSERYYNGHIVCDMHAAKIDGN